MCTMRFIWSFIIVMCIYLWYVHNEIYLVLYYCYVYLLMVCATVIIYIHKKYMTWDIQLVTLTYKWIFSISRERNY